MTQTVYNTLNNQIEVFKPLKEGKISLYACGVTVYDECHVGHAMQAIIYDVIRDYFKYRGYDVTYVRNYTDVDDKIIKRASELGVSALEHSHRMIEDSLADMALLGVKPADVEPRVSDHIPQIVDLIQKLIANGGAYESEGDVYFRVKSFDDYGKLSNRSCEDMQVGARIEVNEKKENPLDFALWKAAKEGEISWPSPWGDGRPGWHIECSAMANHILGPQFDIHGGGKDLIFPHHENEIAQSEKALNCTFANYWVHNGLVTVDGQKMSKSLHNFITIKDAVRDWYPETIRYTILSHHYSSNIDFSEKGFYDSYSRLLYFYNTLARIQELAEAAGDYPQTLPPNVEAPDVEAVFIQAMEDDFNTTVAIRELGQACKFLNDLIAAKKPKMKQKLHLLVQTAAAVKRCANVLGLLVPPPEKALKDIQDYLIRARKIDPDHVAKLINERDEARNTKDWARADQIRDQLCQEGVTIMDTPTGTRWQVQP